MGGGLSFLSPAHGFSCDTYQSLDVVLPSGQFVTATRTNKYSDLFRALKGGGSRFGIVTKYVVKAIHTGTAADKTWYGGSITVCQFSIPTQFWNLFPMIQYPNSSSAALLEALDDTSTFFERSNSAYHLSFRILVRLCQQRSEGR